MVVCGCSNSQTSNKLPHNDSSKLQQLIEVVDHLDYLSKKNITQGKQMADESLSFLVKKDFKAVYPQQWKKLIILKKKTNSLMAKIESIKYQLENSAGGNYGASHKLKKPLATVEVNTIMIQNKVGYQLEKVLNNYVSFLNTEYRDSGLKPFPLIALGNAKNYLYNNDSKKQNQDFAHAHFHHTPVLVATMYLTCFQNTVLRYEEEVIKYMILSLVDKK
ncbi:hypothetical protein M23134_06706 [Microscilla marina ATCC 23134]|uniref:Gliding motility-associated protein GldM N-terminal domain-containing protein n=2 Tax=Microscilla marina TaxID=1027 RepID=A1ZXN6_MICM2|nr:hypothetical protein M23134_06706 [Microscilla marina ATCC 23134]